MATASSGRCGSALLNLDELTLGNLADMEDVAGVDMQSIDLKKPPLGAPRRWCRFLTASSIRHLPMPTRGR